MNDDRVTTRIEDAAFPQYLLNVGFCFALFIAAACLLLSAWYLFNFLESTKLAIEGLLATATKQTLPSNVLELGVLARTAMARYALLSCGVCVAMAFGFLGFALFLIGVRGEMTAQGEGANYKASVTRLAPGTFVILCAVVLIAICITRPTEYGMEKKPDPASQNAPVEVNPLLNDRKKGGE